ncbi:MAG: DUF1330 domain-containing protein [Pseudomonadota bacterium]
MNIDPQREQFDAFKALDRHQPINMLNLIRLNADVTYPDGEKTTGAVAYQRYGEASAPVFQKVGGEIVFRGKPECLLIGPTSETWDIAFIARYPTAGAFMAMVTDEHYRSIVHHRQLAVADSRLLRLGDLDGGATFG